MNWLRLGIPILLGLAAGGLNYMAMNTGTAAERYVRVIEGVKTGTPFDSENLEAIEIRGNVGSLKQTAIPYAMRKVLLSRPALRDLKKGDLLLWRDINPPRPEMELKAGEVAMPLSLEGLALPHQLIQVGDQVDIVIAQPAPPGDGKTAPPPPTFDAVGPFRVVSVGEVVVRQAIDEKGGRTTEQKAITLAIPQTDGKIENRKVLEILRARWDAQTGQKRIVELLLRPRQTPSDAPKGDNDGKRDE